MDKITIASLPKAVTMPSNVTFMKLTRNSSIPLRIFINRKRILLTNAVSINEKSIIKLSSMNILKLSNNDLNDLISDLKEDLTRIFCETSLLELFTNLHLLSRIVIDDLGKRWKVKMITSLNYILNLRCRMNLLSDKDLNFLIERKINLANLLNNHVNNSMHLIKRNIQFTHILKEDSDDMSMDTNDDKKQVDYNWKRYNILGNRSLNPVDLYVCKRPND